MSDHFGNISITPPVTAKPVKRPATRQTRQRPGKRLERPGKAPQPSKGKKSYLLYLLPLALLPILYCIIGFWLAPLYIGKALPERLNDGMGMNLLLDNVTFNPFSFKLTLQGSKLNASRIDAESQNLLTIDRIEADLAPLSLLRNDLVSNALRIYGLNLNIVRAQDNHYNFEELLKGGSPGTTSDIMSFSELPFLFSLNNISIRESKVTFQDIPSATTHTLEQIELDVPTLSNFPFQVDEYIHPRFSTIINGSKIELTGQAAMPGTDGKEGLETKLSCKIQALDLPLYSQYLPTTLPLTLTKGKADGNLQLNFTRGGSESPKISIVFTGEIVDMELADRNNTVTISLPSTTLEGTLQPMNKALHIQKIIFRQPHFITQNAPSLEHLPYLLPLLGKIAPKSREATASSSFDIDLLQIENGDLALASKDAEKKQPVTWTSLQCILKDFSTSGTGTTAKNKGNFSLSGETADTSMSFSWQGKFNDNNSPEGPLILENIPATAFFSGIGLNLGTVSSGKANVQGTFSLAAEGALNNKPIINLIESEINLQGLQLFSGKAPWLEAPVLKLSGFSKNGPRVDFGSLQIENGVLMLQKGKLPEIFTKITSDKSSLSLREIDYTGKITLLDTSGKPLILNSVLLQAANLQAKNEMKESLIFSAKINDKGIFKAKGAARLGPFQATLSSGFSGIEAKTLMPWFSGLPLLTEAEAVMSGKGVLTFPVTAFSGQLRLDNAVFNRDKKPLLSWNSADFQGFSYTRTPFHLGISLLEIDRPVMTWQRNPDDPNPGEQWGAFLQGLLPEKDKTFSQGKDSISISQLDIQAIHFTNGILHYKDNRLQPVWTAEISEFSGQISDLHSVSAKDQARYSLTGKLLNTPFSIEGSADFFSKNLSGRSTYKITDFPLQSFQNYLPDTLGVDGSKGSFDLELSTDWGEAKIAHKAHYLFNDIQAVSAETDTALTLALLRNSDQQVELKVSPTPGGPETGDTLLASTITAFQRKLIKTKVSPLLLASGDYTDLVGNEFAEFQAGGFILSEKGHKTLSRYTAFLAEHPSIGLLITGCADTIIDGDALKKQLEDIEAKRVNQENTRRKAAWQHEKDLAAERQRSQQPSAGTVPQARPLPDPQAVGDYQPVLPQPVVIEDVMLHNLAKERAARIQSLLTEKLGLDPAKVVVSKEPTITSDANNPGNRALIRLNPYAPTKVKPAAPPKVIR